MSIARRLAPAVAVVAWAVVTANPAEAQFAKLLQRVPKSVNTIVLLNAEKLLDSAVAVREDWRKEFRRSVTRGLTRLPLDTRQYVLASQTDFQFMHPVWELGVLSTKDKHDMVYIASKREGKQDTIGGLPAVLLPSDNYLVQFDETTYGALVPASRQAVARWIESTSSDTSEFSPYIQEAIGYADNSGTELIMAMDLMAVLYLEDVRELVKDSKLIADAGIDVEAASECLVSLQGVMLGVTFGERPFGSIKVDFGKDITILQDVAQQLLLDAIGKRGAMIDDFADWKGEVSGTEFRISGPLSEGGLRKILSLVHAPTAGSVVDDEAKGQESQSQQTQGADQQQLTIAATQEYFASVNQYIEDLRDKKPQRIAQYGVWFDRYARKIDELPMLNVDNEMLDFGAYVSQQFRNAAAAIQGIGIRSSVRKVEEVNAAGVPGYWGTAYDGGYSYDGSYYRGGYGYRGAAVAYRPAGGYQQAELRQQQRIRTQVNTQEKARGTSAARAIIQEVNQAVGTMRRNMTQKYNAEF